MSGFVGLCHSVMDEEGKPRSEKNITKIKNKQPLARKTMDDLIQMDPATTFTVFSVTCVIKCHLPYYEASPKLHQWSPHGTCHWHVQ
jgi:hypothetical protein